MSGRSFPQQAKLSVELSVKVPGTACLASALGARHPGRSVQEAKEEKAGKKKAPVKAMSAAEKQAQADVFKKQGNEAF